LGNLAPFGNAIGVGAPPREMPSTTALLEARLAFSRSVASYCRALAMAVEEDDAASHERFRKAVAPIDEFRALGRAKDVEDETDTTDPDDDPPATPAPASGETDGPFIDS
jgi:hypothetical protein